MKSTTYPSIFFPIHRLLPPKENIPPERFLKLGFQVSTLATTTTISVLYIFFCYYVDFWIGIFVCSSFLFIQSYLLWAIKYQKLNDVQVANLFGLMTLSGLGLASITTGGPSSPVNFWFVSTIVVSFWFADRRTGNIWFVACLLFFMLLGIGYFIDYPFPLLLNEEKYTLFKMIMTIGVLGYLSLVFLTINQWRELTINELKKINSTKDRMLAMIGHDLKNPLAVIKMNTRRMKLKSAEEENKINGIERSIKKMNQIIDNMMIYDQLKSKKYFSHESQVDLQIILTDIIEDFKYQAFSKEIIIHDHRESHDSVIINIDQVAIDRILTNLLSNALKYTPSKKNVYIYWQSSGILTIKDEGQGFDQAQKDQLFSLYAKAHADLLHENDLSHGIGLFIVKSLSEQIGLNIALESEGKEKGSCFTLDLTKFLISTT
jgi:signal transduction histidine kinase